MDNQEPGGLDGITRGKVLRPIYAVISGLPGVGKTTLASKAPDPVWTGQDWMSPRHYLV